MHSIENHMVLGPYYPERERPEADPDEAFERHLEERAHCSVCGELTYSGSIIVIADMRYHTDCFERRKAVQK